MGVDQKERTKENAAVKRKKYIYIRDFQRKNFVMHNNLVPDVEPVFDSLSSRLNQNGDININRHELHAVTSSLYCVKYLRTTNYISYLKFIATLALYMKQMIFAHCTK